VLRFVRTDWRPTPEGGLLDGFPATSPRPKPFTLLLEELQHDRIGLLLELDDDELIKRLAQPAAATTDNEAVISNRSLSTRSKRSPDRLLRSRKRLWCRFDATGSIDAIASGWLAVVGKPLLIA